MSITPPQSKSWAKVLELREELDVMGWFKPPPSKSMLLREPACAWFTVGISQVSQQSKFLPALEKTVLRNAVKRWIEVHFYLPVAGNLPSDEDNKHVNIMEHFVTYIWAYYTQNQCPKIPAMTNVGRFMFTYIWRHQHPLFR